MGSGPGLYILTHSQPGLQPGVDAIFSTTTGCGHQVPATRPCTPPENSQEPPQEPGVPGHVAQITGRDRPDAPQAAGGTGRGTVARPFHDDYHATILLDLQGVSR